MAVDGEAIATLRGRHFSPDTRTEGREIERLPDLLRGVARFVDVGANVGQYTWFATRHLRQAEIIAIEADPVLAADLDANARTWAAETGNTIHVINAAVSDRQGTLTFHRTADITTGNILSVNATGETCEVPARRLDDLLAPGPATLVKMDIEGAEFRAIDGAQHLLASDNVRFFMELHGWGDAELRRYPIHVARVFRDAGYAVEKIGTHYLFERRDQAAIASSHAGVRPLLMAKFIYRRYLGFLEPVIRSMARRGLLGRV
jgi:FkbM family methyltransferase